MMKYLSKSIIHACVDLRINYYYREASDRMHSITDINIGRLLSELQTGGNVRFEDGKPSDLWCVN